MIRMRRLRLVVVFVFTIGLVLSLTWQPVSAGNNGGNALYFGRDQYVVIPEGTAINSLGTGSFTLEAWVYPTDYGGDLSIIRDNHDYNLILDSGRHLVAMVFPGGDISSDPTNNFYITTSTGSVSNFQWHHVAAVWNGSSIQLFIDGNPVSSSTSPSSFGGTEQMQIGRDASFDSGFDGAIDEVRIWNAARTTAEIRSTMFQQLAGTESGLVGYWPFDEVGGQSTEDKSTNTNDGTLGSNPTGTDSGDPTRVASTAPLGSLATTYQNRISGMWASQPNTAADGYTSGLDIANVNFLQQTGDDIIFADNSAAFQGGVTSNLATTQYAKKRWARLWELDVNDVNANDGAVDLTFDISEAGGAGNFSTTGNYYLLKRPTGNTGDFTETTVISRSIVGDQVTFRVNVAELGSEFTLGADANSPTAVVLHSLTASPQANSTGLALVGFGLITALVIISLLTRRQRRSNSAS